LDLYERSEGFMKKCLSLLALLAFAAAGPALFAQAADEPRAESKAEEAARKAEEAARAAGEAAGEAAGKAAERVEEGARDLWLGEDGLQWPLVRARRLIGYEVAGTGSRAVGEIADVLLSRAGGVSALLLEAGAIGDQEPGSYLVPAARFLLLDGQLRLQGGLSPRERILPSEEEPLAQRAGEGAVLASKLMAYRVVGSGGGEIGRVDDVVVDLQARRVAYAALGTGGVLGLGQKRIAVPFADLRYDTVQERASIAITADELRGIEGFPRDQWPSRAQEDWWQSDGVSGATPAGG
jgi:sporulation protein YlmC with PRC-barrel domain